MVLVPQLLQHRFRGDITQGHHEQGMARCILQGKIENGGISPATVARPSGPTAGEIRGFFVLERSGKAGSDAVSVRARTQGGERQPRDRLQRGLQEKLPYKNRSLSQWEG